MKILYIDDDVLVCIKPARVLSNDEPGGLPDLIRQELGDQSADIRTVHRLDRVVGGVMVLARNPQAASELSSQIRDDIFEKSYLAVVHGHTERNGTFRDLLYRDKARRMTMVAAGPGKGVQEAILHYQTLASYEDKSLIRVTLVTGRTHQIRVQFASRGFPLVGERKYSTLNDDCEIALWSQRVGFLHPRSGQKLSFQENPDHLFPWNQFQIE